MLYYNGCFLYHQTFGLPLYLLGYLMIAVRINWFHSHRSQILLSCIRGIQMSYGLRPRLIILSWEVSTPQSLRQIYVVLRCRIKVWGVSFLGTDESLQNIFKGEPEVTLSEVEGWWLWPLSEITILLCRRPHEISLFSRSMPALIRISPVEVICFVRVANVPLHLINLIQAGFDPPMIDTSMPVWSPTRVIIFSCFSYLMLDFRV